MSCQYKKGNSTDLCCACKIKLSHLFKSYSPSLKFEVSEYKSGIFEILHHLDSQKHSPQLRLGSWPWVGGWRPWVGGWRPWVGNHWFLSNRAIPDHNRR